MSPEYIEDFKDAYTKCRIFYCLRCGFYEDTGNACLKNCKSIRLLREHYDAIINIFEKEGVGNERC